MKDESSRILEYLICDDELHHIRNWLYPLNASNPVELDEAIEQLSDAISQITLNNHEHTGMYHLFLGCLFYEKNMNQMAIQHAQSAIRQMWGSTVNKALAHWLLGLIFSNIGDSPKARHELQNALKLLAANSSLNSPRANREKRSRQTIQQDIGNTLKQFLQQPIFRTVRPDPASVADRFPIQDPPANEENGTPISLHIPISITNEFNPINTNSYNHTTEKMVESHNEPMAESEPMVENESRTDRSGFMVLPSLPIYAQKVKAGNLGEPVLAQYLNLYAEIEQIHFEGKPHSLHSLRSQFKIKPTTGEWGWMKVSGHSMNNLKGLVSIQEDDYILIQKHSNPNENEIVVAFRVEANTNDAHLFVKRFKKDLLMLFSETTKKGAEYDPIDINKENVQIYGIVHAVAKPVT